MHEMHMVKDIFSDVIRIAEENKVGRVTAVYLKMGEFSEINEEILRYYFKENGKNTILEGAALNIEKTDIRELRLVSMDCD